MRKCFCLFFLVFLLITGCGDDNITPFTVSPFYIEPYLQNVTQNSITVEWWTDTEEKNNYVMYGSSFEYSEAATDEYITETGKYLHRAVISNLAPQTAYKYRVHSGTVTGKEYVFHTSVNEMSNFHFAVLGDGRTDNDEIITRHRSITQVAMKQGIDFAVHTGDFVTLGVQEYWDRFMRRIVTTSDPNDPGIAFASNVPYYLVMGNHEDSDGKGNTENSFKLFNDYTDPPLNNSANPLWNKCYYSFTYGVATFISINSSANYLPAGSVPGWKEGSEQYTWLVSELEKAKNNSVFTFIIIHESPYCRGEGGEPDDRNHAWDLRVLDPLFRQYSVDGVFSSHDHLVEHCLTGPAGFEVNMDKKDPANLNYIVMGDSGITSQNAQQGWESWMSVKGNSLPPFYTTYFYDWAQSTHCSFLDVRIEKQSDSIWRCTCKIIRDDGNIFDEFYFERSR